MSAPDAKPDVDSSEFDWRARANWRASVMQVRCLTDGEAKMELEMDKNRHIRKIWIAVISALPGIILAIQQLVVAVFT